PLCTHGVLVPCASTTLSSLMLCTIPPPSAFFCTRPSPTAIYTLSLHDALPICENLARFRRWEVVETYVDQSKSATDRSAIHPDRSEEHTSELQSRFDLVCRLLLEKKKTKVS